MCRSIKVLRRESTLASAEEIAAASLQFVRKVSGYRKPSKAKQEAFDAAVREIAATTNRLLQVVSESHPGGRSGERVTAVKPVARKRAVAASQPPE